MNDHFTGKVALITGAASGIGAASARLMAERGADVAIIDVNEEGAERTAAGIRERGRRSAVRAGDVTEAGAVEAAVASFRATLGRIDILVNNAGIGSGGGFLVEEITEAAFERMLAVHVKGAFLCTKAVVPVMKQNRFGRIVNVSSNRGLVGFERSSHYCAAKAALLGLTKAWAKEFAPWGIRVNAVAPGLVLTPMSTVHGMDAINEEASWNLQKRGAEPEEIASTIAFLASPEADYFTGQVLSPNGGDPIVGI